MNTDELLRHAMRVESWLRVGSGHAGSESDGAACREAADALRDLAAALRESERQLAAERAAHEATRRALADAYYWRERHCRDSEAASKRADANWYEVERLTRELADMAANSVCYEVERDEVRAELALRSGK